MPNAGELTAQVAREKERRNRLAVPAFGGGFLYLLSAIIIASTINGAPTVGLLQGLTPALSGVANPAVSPRAPWVKYISHHSFNLIAGGVLSAIALAVLTLILLLLIGATTFRRPQSWRAARALVVIGGVGLVLTSVGHEVVTAIETHHFASGHNYSSEAVEHALLTSTANAVVGYVELLAGFAFVVGMIGTVVNALRVGLLPRWMGILGVFVSLLIFIPDISAELQVIPAFWMVMMGILLLERWPNADPPAWAAGVAMPWPPRGGGRVAGAKPAVATPGGGSVPAPVAPESGRASRKRRRGARG